jgi:ribonuclease HII
MRAARLPGFETLPFGHAGVDEAGRGCLAGPVVAAAVILPEPCGLSGLADSKQLSESAREALAPLIKAQALAWALGLSWPAEIDATDILAATFAAMGRAVRRLARSPSLIVVDGNRLVPQAALGRDLPQRAVVGGDALVPAVSAASILAKVFRDRLMRELDRRHPGYGLSGHKGYGTAEHLSALRRLGPSPVHRRTFRGVAVVSGREEDRAWLPGISI